MTDMAPPTREELLALLTDLHEEVVTSAFVGGRAILIRELTARQRLSANAAALAESPDVPDNALYRAMLIQQAVVDPRTGTPYADGRTDASGAPAIDPRTRAPMFTIADVGILADGRDLATEDLVSKITRLGALGPRAMFRGALATDRPERDAGAGDPAVGDAAHGDASARPGDTDGGAALAARPDRRRGKHGSLES